MAHVEKERLRTRSGKLLHTAKVRSTGGRDRGVARSANGHLDVRLTTPGGAGSGTNPEELFAAGWSACFESAMRSRGPQEEDRAPGRSRRRGRSGPQPRRRRLLPARPPQRQSAGA